MNLVLEDAKALLRTLINSIDRKAEVSVSLKEGDQPGVNVAITLRKHKTTIAVSAAKLEEAVRDSIGRSQLRTSLKRVIDRMTFEVTPFASTKMLRGATVDGGFFRPPQGGRGRR